MDSALTVYKVYMYFIYSQWKSETLCLLVPSLVGDMDCYCNITKDIEHT